MNPEKQTTRPEKVSRNQKLARRFAPLALIAAGLTAHGANQLLQPNDHERETATEVVATAHSEVSAEFRGGNVDPGWGHDVAEEIIEKAVSNGLEELLSEEESANFFDYLEKVMNEQGVYEQANQALEMAGYSETLPDKGDKLTIRVEVTLDSDDDISYEVTDAHIEDLHNNQS